MVTLGMIAEYVDSELIGDPDKIIAGVKPLKTATGSDIAFLTNPKYVSVLKTTQAAAVLLTKEHAHLSPVDCLVVENSALSANQLIQYFAHPVKNHSGIHHTAVVADSAEIDETASIGAYVVIGEGVKIGARTVIHPHVVISERCEVGTDSILYPHVTLYADTRCCNRVIIHASTVIGSDGFGNVKHQGVWNKIPHIGGVVLEDDVEIGASTTVDRGVLEDTILSKGVKLDNQIHIAHNVKIGDNTVMAACAGVAGSTIIGESCMLGGRVSIVDNLSISPNSVILACSDVLRSITEPGMYSSAMHCQPVSVWNRLFIHYLRLIDMVRSVKKLTELEKGNHD
jgi:UDP-3-O-[3-hydroxymyristoyl] glucosamine N-acyltransferase